MCRYVGDHVLERRSSKQYRITHHKYWRWGGGVYNTDRERQMEAARGQSAGAGKQEITTYEGAGSKIKSGISSWAAVAPRKLFC